MYLEHQQQQQQQQYLRVRWGHTGTNCARLTQCKHEDEIMVSQSGWPEVDSPTSNVHYYQLWNVHFPSDNTLKVTQRMLESSLCIAILQHVAHCKINSNKLYIFSNYT